MTRLLYNATFLARVRGLRSACVYFLKVVHVIH